MPTIRNALGIGEPKMVIRLMNSSFGAFYWKCFERCYTERFPTKRVPEVSVETHNIVERRMLLFAKQVLLPLAMKTHALVIGSDICDLTCAFAQIAAPVQHELGNECPFHFVVFARAPYYFVRTQMKDTVEHRMLKRCKWWKARETKPEVMRHVLKERFGDDDGFWPRARFLPESYSEIMTECVLDNQLSLAAHCNLQNLFVSHLAQHLPVLAINTMGDHGWKDSMGFVSGSARGGGLQRVDRVGKKRLTSEGQARVIGPTSESLVSYKAWGIFP